MQRNGKERTKQVQDLCSGSRDSIQYHEQILCRNTGSIKAITTTLSLCKMVSITDETSSLLLIMLDTASTVSPYPLTSVRRRILNFTPVGGIIMFWKAFLVRFVPSTTSRS